MKNGFIYSMN